VAWPPFDTSAMDGYAVRLSDVSPARRWRNGRGLVAAGDLRGARLSPGEAVRVMTGAPIPDGTEAIVPVEDVRRENGRIFARVAPRAGHHIRRRAEVLEAGATLLARGTRLSPSDLALGALAGADPIEVHRRPRVSIAVTGSELVAASARPGPGQLRDSNGPMLSALCAARGVNASLRGAVEDEDGACAVCSRKPGATRTFSSRAAACRPAISTSYPRRRSARGSRSCFIAWPSARASPSRSDAVGARSGSGCPATPSRRASVSISSRRPALDSLEGDAHPGPRVRRARLARDLAVKGERETYRDAVLEDDGDGGARVSPSESRGSHDLLAHARANALIRIPAGAGNLRAGSPGRLRGPGAMSGLRRGRKAIDPEVSHRTAAATDGVSIRIYTLAPPGSGTAGARSRVLEGARRAGEPFPGTHTSCVEATTFAALDFRAR
jgi:molybdopterin molybdotransferase